MSQSRRLGLFFLLCLPTAWFTASMASALMLVLGPTRGSMGTALAWLEFALLSVAGLGLLIFQRPPSLVRVSVNLTLTLWTCSWVALLLLALPAFERLGWWDLAVLLANGLAMLSMLEWAFRVATWGVEVFPRRLSLAMALSLAVVALASAPDTTSMALVAWTPSSGGVVGFAHAQQWCYAAGALGAGLALAALAGRQRPAGVLAALASLAVAALIPLSWSTFEDMRWLHIPGMLAGCLIFASLSWDWLHSSPVGQEESEFMPRPSGSRAGCLAWALLLAPIFLTDLWFRVDFKALYSNFDADRLAALEDQAVQIKAELAQVDTARRVIARERAQKAKLEAEVESLTREIARLEKKP